MTPRRHVPPVTRKFGDELLTSVGRNAPGPSLSTDTYSSSLSHPTSTVPKSAAAIETAGRDVIVTTWRPISDRSPVDAAGDHGVEGDDPAGVGQHRVAVGAWNRAGRRVAGGPPELSQQHLGDDDVAVGRLTAARHLRRQQVRRIGDERDLAAVGVDRR